MNKTYATKADYNRAPIGYPFMECCGSCGQETGVILVKKTGDGRRKKTDGLPKYLIPSEETRCEFCNALGHWFAQEKIDPKETGLQYGMAKCVSQDADGVRTDLAMIPFDSGDDGREVTLDPEGSKEQVELKHRMVIEARQDGDAFTLIRVLEEGV